ASSTSGQTARGLVQRSRRHARNPLPLTATEPAPSHSRDIPPSASSSSSSCTASGMESSAAIRRHRVDTRPAAVSAATATSSLASGLALLYTMVVPCPAPRTRWAQEVAMRRFWLGVLATLVTGAVGVLAFLGLGLMPVSADAKPGAFESWLAGFARDAAIERAAPER